MIATPRAKESKAVKAVTPLYTDYYEEFYDNEREAEDTKHHDFYFANFQISPNADPERLKFIKTLLKNLNESMVNYAAEVGINYSSNKTMFEKDFSPTKVVIEGIDEEDDEEGGTFCKKSIFEKSGINVDFLIDKADIYSTLYLTSTNISFSKTTTRDKTQAMLVFYYNSRDHCLEIKALCANQIERFHLAGSKIVSFFTNALIYFLSKYPDNFITLCANSVPSAINFYKNNDFEKDPTSRLLIRSVGNKTTGEKFSSLEPIHDISFDSISEEGEENTQSSLEDLELRLHKASQGSSLDFLMYQSSSDEDIPSVSNSIDYLVSSDSDDEEKKRNMKISEKGGKSKKTRRKPSRKTHRKTRRKPSRKTRRKTSRK
jgi:hypothetical protein